MQKRSHLGFTLIELLVVMAIMSILVGVGINTFSIAQKKARDAKRKADLRTIQTALEAYKVNNNGSYPKTLWTNANNALGVSSTIGALVPNYLNKLPTDPKEGTTICTMNWTTPANCYSYQYTSCNSATDGRSYTLAAHLEDTKDSEVTETGRVVHKWCNNNGLASGDVDQRFNEWYFVVGGEGKVGP